MSEERKPGYQFSCTIDLGQGKQTQVIGNFYRDADVPEMTAELDKVWQALDKQRIKRLELPTAQQALSDQNDKLCELKTEVGKLSLKKQAGHLTSAEKSQMENHLATIQRLEEVIPRGEAFVAELERKAA